MSVQVTRFFQGRWTVFFATTYTFDPRVFNDFWFPRLGNPPLNANILVDAGRLDRLYAQLDEEPWALRRINSDYLVRGVRLAHGAFHSKTYFWANNSGGTLLVGSGNLGINGLEEGHEVFSVFRSGDEAELGTIRTWRDWAGQLVSRVGDDRLTARWLAVQREAHWLQGKAEGSQFIHNLESSMLSQLVEGMPGHVDDLYVHAPFYDARAAVLRQLIARLSPRAVHLYLSKDMSVHGASLVSVLSESGAEIHIMAYEPSTFVHAKLVGVIAEDRGRLLSGSANLSQAALLGSVQAGSSNVEAGILLDISPDRVRAAFIPYDLEVTRASIAQVSGLKYGVVPETTGPANPLVLRSVTLLPDGRARVAYTGIYDGEQLLLANEQGMRLIAGQETVGALAGVEQARLVWLSAASGEPLSNRVVADLPRQLDGWLQGRVTPDSAPSGLQAGDLGTPIGQMLQRLHVQCVFDIDDTPALRNNQRPPVEEVDEESAEDDATFWDRLQHEELQADPRTSIYHRWAAGERHFAANDDILSLLHTMLNRAPAQWQPRVLDGQHDTEGGKGKEEPTHYWTPEQRLRVRLYNVLEKWSRATSDARLCRYIHRFAPVRNYIALLDALRECWSAGYLPGEQVVKLTYALLSNFVGLRAGSGYYKSADAVTRQEASRMLRGEPAELAAALVYVAFQPGMPWASYIFEWQPLLMQGIDDGLLATGPVAARVAEDITGKPCAEEDIERRLYEIALFENDDHWCSSLRQEFDLESVAFSQKGTGMVGTVGCLLQVQGIEDPLHDPRLVVIIRRLMVYKRTNHVAVWCGQNGQNRVSANLGETLWMKLGTKTVKSDQALTMSIIDGLEAAGSGWAGLLPADVAEHSA